MNNVKKLMKTETIVMACIVFVILLAFTIGNVTSKRKAADLERRTHRCEIITISRSIYNAVVGKTVVTNGYNNTVVTFTNGTIFVESNTLTNDWAVKYCDITTNGVYTYIDPPTK